MTECIYSGFGPLPGESPVGVMTPVEFAARMRRITERDEPEGDHKEADELMCGVLYALGYGEGVDVFLGSSRWYA